MIEYSSGELRRKQLAATAVNAPACGSYTASEVGFLLGAHPLELAVANGRDVLPADCDLRALGCPERIFHRILEQRARKLGNTFTEFRATQRPATADDLDSKIAGAKIF
jgi:hypothetical protein